MPITTDLEYLHALLLEVETIIKFFVAVDVAGDTITKPLTTISRDLVAVSALTLTKPDPLLLKIIDPANAQLFF